MQEELEQRTVSVSIQAAKLSGRVLRAAIAAVLQKMEQERTMPKVGRNSMKRLTYKDPGANTIEVSGRIRSFERYARKHQVRYHIVTAAIAGVFLFALYTVFQIPGYYKYGSIKGRVFMYIPVAGFLVTLLLLSKMPAIGNSIISVVESSPILLVFLAVFAIVVMYAVSIFLSIRVMKNKEM